jgi:hypothetical protein
MRKLILSWLVVLSCCVGSTVLAAPQTGWWWNPAESGRGFFVESDNGITFIGAYLYDDDGHAAWLVSGSPNADPYNYTGQLYSMSKGQTLYGSYVAPVGPNNVGTLSAHFSDDTHGTITWPGGTVAIERQIFGGTGAAFQPFSGWWWNPAEGGSGYSVEVQGKNLFIVGFMYDDTGRPVWYFSAGPMSTDNTYHGTVLQFANGQTMSGPYRPPGTPTTIATLDVTFKAVNQAQFVFTELAPTAQNEPKPKAGKSSTKELQPQFPKKFIYLPPETFTGFFGQYADTHYVGGPFLTADGSAATNLDIVWTHDKPDPKPDTFYYKLSNAEMAVSYAETSKVVIPEGGSADCKHSGGITVKLGSGDTSTAILEVGVDQRYLLYVHVDEGARPVPTTGECVGSDGNKFPFNPTVTSPSVDFHYESVVVGDTIAGKGTKTTSGGGLTTTISYSWNFKAFRP